MFGVGVAMVASSGLTGFDDSDDGNGDGGGCLGRARAVAVLQAMTRCRRPGRGGSGRSRRRSGRWCLGLGAVGKAGGVAEVDVVGAGDEWEQLAQDGEAAEAGVKDADGQGMLERSLGRGWPAVRRGAVGVAAVSTAG